MNNLLEPILARLADAPAGTPATDILRDTLTSGAEALRDRFAGGVPVNELVAGRAELVDAVLRRVWADQLAPLATPPALVAVGGYGRSELHPCSDVDIMVLLPGETVDETLLPPIEQLLALLWDIGLEVGHSVRTVADCVAQAEQDITVATALMESRRIAGPEALFEAMRAAVGPDRIWPSRAFFEAKLREQHARHLRYDDTEYNLEPNLKGSPGGLRDIQMIGWVAKRHFGAGTLRELVDHGFLTEHEFASLMAGREFLWQVRFALHVLTGRAENRLLFDYQMRIAELFGYEDASYTLAVEQLMQRYYRTAKELNRLNEMLLQLFEEAILLDRDAAPRTLNDYFESRNKYLTARSDDVFARHPSAILELFLTLQQHPQLKGVSATTIRLLRGSLDLIDDQFRQDPRNHRLFLAILRAPEGVTHELRRMNRYGVLGRYVPAFGRIVGRMQYDLFHAYTVDAHTLFVVSNLRRFALSRYNDEFPLCSKIMQALPRQELAYLAGLFHDIAKGRGGDHSELGAVDAEAFCLEHGLAPDEARLVAWLVRHHLLLSTSAQKKDISDPEVINAFAREVGDELHLDYLYVLTVADVRGTNPKLWNSWKASLFEQFYRQTQRALKRGRENPIDRDELVGEKQRAARRLLEDDDTPPNTTGVWQHLSDQYFLRHAPEEIAWHTRKLHETAADGGPLVSVQPEPASGHAAVLVYRPQALHSFARTTGVLDRLGLNILDARITPTADGHTLDTYLVLERTVDLPIDAARSAEIQAALHRAIVERADEPVAVTRKAPRQVRMFDTETQINFSVDAHNARTIMELVTGDRPGLLSRVGQIFRDNQVTIETAKITTAGERAEDVFYIVGPDQRPLDEAATEQLRTALHAALDA